MDLITMRLQLVYMSFSVFIQVSLPILSFFDEPWKCEGTYLHLLVCISLPLRRYLNNACSPKHMCRNRICSLKVHNGAALFLQKTGFWVPPHLLQRVPQYSHERALQRSKNQENPQWGMIWIQTFMLERKAHKQQHNKSRNSWEMSKLWMIFLLLVD